ncbi:MAG: FTR1 family protein [Cyanobacteria bacterium P01_D01_bin.123]
MEAVSPDGLNLSAALPGFAIALREGVEAALVVGIVLACLHKADRTDLNRWAYGGIGVGLAASTVVGLALQRGLQWLTAVNPTYTPVVEPLLKTTLGLVAIACLSWMLVWMTQQAKSLKGEIEGSVTASLRSQRAGWGVLSLITIAVAREGFELVVFLLTDFQQGIVPLAGAIIGILGATGIGIAMFGWGVRINIRDFFRVMGIFLLLVVGGLVVSVCKYVDASAIALSQNLATDFCTALPANASCVLGPQIWNAAATLPDKRGLGLVLKIIFGYRDRVYLAQIIAYVIFWLAIGKTYLQSAGITSSPIKSSAIKSSAIKSSAIETKGAPTPPAPSGSES